MKQETYIAPTAEWILLAPAEDLMLGETSKEDSFAMSGWDDGKTFGDSVITGGGGWGEDGA